MGIVGGLIGAAVKGYQSYDAAVQGNKSVKQSAEQNMYASRLEAKQGIRTIQDQGYKLNQTANSVIGQAYNQQGFSTSGAMSRAIGQMFNDSNLDAGTLKQGEINIRNGLDIKNQMIQNSAKSKLVNVAIATQNGAYEGFMEGFQMQANLNSYNKKAQTNEAYNQASSMFASNPVQSMAMNNYLNAGGDPGRMNQPGALAPYQSTAQLQYDAYNRSMSQQNSIQNASTGLGFANGNLFDSNLGDFNGNF